MILLLVVKQDLDVVVLFFFLSRAVLFAEFNVVSRAIEVDKSHLVFALNF
jgi:hypothetical protein